MCKKFGLGFINLKKAGSELEGISNIMINIGLRHRMQNMSSLLNFISILSEVIQTKKENTILIEF